MMNKRIFHFTSAATLIFGILFPIMLTSCAQGPGGGSVGGVVIDSPRKLLEAVIVGRVTHNGIGLKDAQVRVKGYESSDLTDRDGHFEMEFHGMTRLGVNRMRVQVEASAPGYRTRTKGVYVEANRITEIIIELLPRE